MKWLNTNKSHRIKLFTMLKFDHFTMIHFPFVCHLILACNNIRPYQQVLRPSALLVFTPALMQMITLIVGVHTQICPTYQVDTRACSPTGGNSWQWCCRTLWTC